MNYKKGMQMLWLTSWPHGKLVQVTIIDKNSSMGDKYYYIRKPDGTTDTTTEDFLFDYPETFKPGPNEETQEEPPADPTTPTPEELAAFEVVQGYIDRLNKELKK